MRALDVNIIGHGGMSVGARERVGEGGIAISARASGGRGGLSRGITSLATRRLYFQQDGIDRRLNYFVRPAYTWTWPEKTDLHHPLSSSPPLHAYVYTRTHAHKHFHPGNTSQLGPRLLFARFPGFK